LRLAFFHLCGIVAVCLLRPWSGLLAAKGTISPA
jgi:hypothetical protein